MIEGVWKFVHEKILSNVFSISLLLLGTLVLVVAVSLGPKFLQKEKKSKRGAIDKKVDNAFKKAEEEIGSSIVEEFKQVEDDVKEDVQEEMNDVKKEMKEIKEEVKEVKDESLSVEVSSSSSKGEEGASKASISSKRRTRKK